MNHYLGIHFSFNKNILELVYIYHKNFRNGKKWVYFELQARKD